jgi:HlyD family secretion protein
MPVIDQLEIHSEEVQEILGKIPGWILRWGLLIIFSTVIVLIVGSYFFKFPKIVTAPIIITTYNTPADLKANVGGKIECILVQNEQNISKGMIVAVIENTAEYEDIFRLDSMLLELTNTSDWTYNVKNKQLSCGYHLGSIQNSFVAFKKNWYQYQHYLKQNLIPLKIELYEQQVNKLIEVLIKTLQEKKLHKRDLELAYRSFERDSLLFAMDVKVLNKELYDKSKQSYIQKQASYITFEKTIINADFNILELKENIIELKLQYDRELLEYQMNLDESYQLLKLAVDQWIEKYVITSSIEGKVTFINYWSVNQMIKAGDRLASVVPLDETKIVAKAIIPASSLGEIQKEQMVHIKLSGFPSTQYGMLNGKLSSISLVPEEGGYVAMIDIIGGMTSSYKEQLKFYQEMTGTAEIITENKRLISRFIKPLQMLYSSPDSKVDN